MTGFDPVDLERPGFFARFLGRKPRQNALREVQNLLAERSVQDLTASDVENILSSYELPREQAQVGLKSLYRTGLNCRVKDLHLSDDDLAELRQLRHVLGLNDDDSKSVEIDLLRDLYRVELRTALLDGDFSDADKTKLESLATSFCLSESMKEALYNEEATAALQQAFNAAVADRRLTPEEEQRLARMSEHLGMKATHDRDSLKALDRFRLLARIENGGLPEIRPSVLLQNGERCHVEFPSTLHELRTMTRAVRYHGPTGRIRIMKGLSWRYGHLNVQRVTTEQLRPMDSGILFITSKRLLFNGLKKSTSIPLKKVIHFTLYKDALQIEKDTGRDQFFRGEGDLEILGAILEAALRAGR